MNKLVDAMVVEDNEQGLTLNGAKTNKSSLSACLDLFFNIGASRNKNIIPLFHKAYLEDKTTALKIAMWARDCRGGAGERQVFKDICRWLAETNNGSSALILLSKVPQLGRYDDVFSVFDSSNKLAVDGALYLLSDALLKEENGLAAKWCPRKGKYAAMLRNHLRLSPKGYRKLLVRLSKTVEQQMCAQQWDKINYEGVPSVAFARYMHAFSTHDNYRFQEFLGEVNSGEKKINASVVFPHDVMRALNAGQTDAANAQWKALPDYIGGSKKKVLVMADVSGSMGCKVSGSVTALDVCISLALYTSEKLKGAFKDTFLTFSSAPELQRVSGRLYDRYNTLRRAHWEQNTNLQAAFDVILETAVKHKVPKKDMPTTILILSDMEFDASQRGYGYGRAMPTTNFAAIEAKYKAAKYKMPEIVFWNLNNISQGGNVPVVKSQKNVALISGFSPSILTNVLKHGNVDPIEMMNSVLDSPRYNI